MAGSGGILAGKQPFWAFLKKNFKFFFGRPFRLRIEYQSIGLFGLPWLYLGILVNTGEYQYSPVFTSIPASSHGFRHRVLWASKLIHHADL
jgi:hypothetical protein